jgi:hypothetical protein
LKFLPPRSPPCVDGPFYRPVVLAVVTLAVLVLPVMGPEGDALDMPAISSPGRELRTPADLAGLLMLTEGWRCSIPARRAEVGGSTGEEEEPGFGRDRLICASEYADPAPAKREKHRHPPVINSALCKKGDTVDPPEHRLAGKTRCYW